MDEKSHKLFAKILLEAAGKSDTSPEWGIAPDIDMSFLHRWYRHRVSVLPKIYVEFPLAGRLPGFRISDADLDAIALCVVSHLYLDIFNGWVFPFGIWNPIYPQKTVIDGVIEDTGKPELLVKELRRLAGESRYPEKFYSDSRRIMEMIFPVISSGVRLSTPVEELTAHMVWRLSGYAGGTSDNDSEKRISLYNKAMNQIADFTGNNKFRIGSWFVFYNQEYTLFEINYAKLINRGMEG